MKKIPYFNFRTCKAYHVSTHVDYVESNVEATGWIQLSPKSAMLGVNNYII